MSSHLHLMISLMIRRYGETVQHKRKVKTDIGDGEAEWSYSVQEPKRGQFTRITPFDNTVNRWGRRVEADAIGTFLPDTDIEDGDRLKLEDGWYEITTKLIHKTGTTEDYMEVLLRRRI